MAGLRCSARQLGRWKKALDAIEEAIGIYRDLARANPDALLPDLAMSLNTQSNRDLLGGLIHEYDRAA